MIDFNNFECAIFDLDGTLIDSTGVWNRVDMEFLERRGIPVTEEYMQEIKHHNFETGALYTIKCYGLKETKDEIIKEWYDMAVEEYANHIELKPFAKDLLQKLKQKGLKLALATSSDRALFELCLKRLGIYELFDVYLQTSEVGRGKEFPDIYEEAARRCDTDISRCVVFEDILVAVRSAKQGGFYTVGVADYASENNRAEIMSICDIFVDNYSQIISDLT